MRSLLLLLFLLLAVPAFGAFCDDLILDIGTCKYTGTNVIVDIAPKQHAHDFVLVFYTPEGEFTYQGGTGIYSRRLQGASLFERGSYMRFNWPTSSEPDSVKLFHKDCVGKDYRFTQVTCTRSRACSDSSVCPSASNCSMSGFCEELACSACERIENHMCVPKCVDDSACTRDSCTELGNCLFEEIENCCEFNEHCNDDLVCTQEYCSGMQCVRSSVACESGSCVEPTGCLTIDTQWDATATSRFSYRVQSLLISNPLLSAILFSIVLLCILALIYAQTSKEFKKLIANSKKNRFVEPHARQKPKLK